MLWISVLFFRYNTSLLAEVVGASPVVLGPLLAGQGQSQTWSMWLPLIAGCSIDSGEPPTGSASKTNRRARGFGVAGAQIKHP